MNILPLLLLTFALFQITEKSKLEISRFQTSEKSKIEKLVSVHESYGLNVKIKDSITPFDKLNSKDLGTISKNHLSSIRYSFFSNDSFKTKNYIHIKFHKYKFENDLTLIKAFIIEICQNVGSAEGTSLSKSNRYYGFNDNSLILINYSPLFKSSEHSKFLDLILQEYSLTITDDCARK